ncbi:iron dicitrate ABC transporter ATP-binding protein [Wenzhouxiangella sp. XN79A]|uniref:polysaccharide biosynthesis/export family protein n=1 Tax=Wenzhouxiangella sp. XN79A TaxID=2724193 RepID=UPI00144A73D3|nr:polysaccharide biosynthesis/export family protein [Wenzhouxiangella sp. XN79A]NKI36408.1 iron dicitrate ABC transporter ATP-binding protein [Wenzhouxiangella sp. XN79A]
MNRMLLLLLALPLLAALTGCASNNNGADTMSLAEFQSQYTSANPDIDTVNQQLLSLSVGNEGDVIYRLGAGDEIRMNVFGVEELSGEYRIDGNGRISLPLIGQIDISGYTLADAEDVLERRYGERYLRNPQITVSVVEFRSQQFTAVGAVGQPRVYNVERKITLIEALAMAGGLGQHAGGYVYLTDKVRDPESGELGMRNVAVAVEDLTSGRTDVNLVLGEDALINVPEAGSIFVEGAVERPGVFRAPGEITVLKAIAMAGGLKFEANRNTLHVLRRDQVTGEWQQNTVAMEDIRLSPNNDLPLSDGDIVVVQNGPIRTAWIGLWNGLARIAMLGFRPL